MIADTLKNAAMYYPLGRNIEAALRFLERDDLGKLPVGRYAIDGEVCYALIQDYETKPMGNGIWEAHRKYIDVQFVVRGEERIGYASIDSMKWFQPYDEAQDVTLLEGQGDFLTLRAGAFVILFPQDVHMPGMALDGPTPVRKVVVKVKAAT